MRSNRITGAVVATALVAGVTGGVLTVTSATADAPHHSALTRPAAADTAATTLIDQARALGRVGHLATPVARLVEDSLTGTASRDTLSQDAAAARASIDATRQANAARTTDRAARDATSDALADLQKAVSGLISSLTGTLSGLLSAATGVVGGLLSTISAVLGGALGSAPSVPSTPSLPAPTATAPVTTAAPSTAAPAA
ncbi:hypothetical protein SAMN05216267_105636 [Actinacidiphila rubida]|uniref:Uncharacterized protein n=1 Tax=Actinacidiphila rubida TaxID=310780 RepID=A0A1H8TPJ1_9ACTN|nr:hypothetical protein [Actinacidiphila rubida]SEO92787.1 hypothetical protein SAMN05216267_105636 [Actinacidiphila rubida]